MAKIISLYHYPLQGAQGQAVDTMQLAHQSPPPFDRVFGIVEEVRRAATDDHQQTIHKLCSDKSLLTLSAHYDGATKNVKIYKADGDLLVQGILPKNDQYIADAIAEFLGCDGEHGLSMGYKNAPELFGGFLQGRATISGAYKKTAITIINLASVRELAAKVGGAPIDEKRFRANVYIDDLPPFAELSWIEQGVTDGAGQTIECGDVKLRVIEQTQRCAITEVNPKTGQRDFLTLSHLKKNYHHINMGVYADTIKDGTIAVGDNLQAI